MRRGSCTFEQDRRAAAFSRALGCSCWSSERQCTAKKVCTFLRRRRVWIEFSSPPSSQQRKVYSSMENPSDREDHHAVLSGRHKPQRTDVREKQGRADPGVAAIGTTSRAPARVSSRSTVTPFLVAYQSAHRAVGPQTLSVEKFRLFSLNIINLNVAVTRSPGAAPPNLLQLIER